MVWQELKDSPEVVYGALLALVIVVLLTPVVGNVARYLGVVDRPGGRRVHERIDPASSAASRSSSGSSFPRLRSSTSHPRCAG